MGFKPFENLRASILNKGSLGEPKKAELVKEVKEKERPRKARSVTEKTKKFGEFKREDFVFDKNKGIAQIKEITPDGNKVVLKDIETGEAYSVGFGDLRPIDFEIKVGSWVRRLSDNLIVRIVDIKGGKVLVEDKKGKHYDELIANLGSIELEHIDDVVDLEKYTKSTPSPKKYDAKELEELEPVLNKLEEWPTNNLLYLRDYLSLLNKTEDNFKAMSTYTKEHGKYKKGYLDLEEKLKMSRNREEYDQNLKKRDNYLTEVGKDGEYIEEYKKLKDNWKTGRDGLEKQYHINEISEALTAQNGKQLPSEITQENIELVKFIKENRLGSLSDVKRESLVKALENIMEDRKKKIDVRPEKETA